MNLLLDTHVVIWSFTNDPTLSHAARDAITDSEAEVYVSAAVITDSDRFFLAKI